MRKIEDREEGGSGGGVYAKLTEYVRKQSPVKVIGVFIALSIVLYLL